MALTTRDAVIEHALKTGSAGLKMPIQGSPKIGTIFVRLNFTKY